MSRLVVLGLNWWRIALNCGLGVTRRLVEAGASQRDPDAILITHLHSDHLLEPWPLAHTACIMDLTTPIQIYGLAGTRARWDGFTASMADDNRPRVLDDRRIRWIRPAIPPISRRLPRLRQDRLAHKATRAWGIWC
jgi:ribonuclease BN (tRNA processing enzyme)